MGTLPAKIAIRFHALGAVIQIMIVTTIVMNVIARVSIRNFNRLISKLHSLNV